MLVTGPGVPPLAGTTVTAGSPNAAPASPPARAATEPVPNGVRPLQAPPRPGTPGVRGCNKRRAETAAEEEDDESPERVAAYVAALTAAQLEAHGSTPAGARPADSAALVDAIPGEAATEEACNA